MTSLSPISLSVYQEQLLPARASRERQPGHSRVEQVEEGPGDRVSCLFCTASFEDDDQGLENSLEHMLIEHGLFIPNRVALLDVASFLGYLATQVHHWHECLYCGIVKGTTQTIRDHMRDSGHCKLNFEKEPELVEFWGHARGDEPKSSFLPGSRNPEKTRKVVASTKGRRPTRKAKHINQKHSALRADTEALHPSHQAKSQNCGQVARRDELGVQNISFQKRQALAVAVKRSQKAEAIAVRANEWIYAQKANSQKHDQAYGSLSWAKGGMHNLLPR